MSNVAEPIKEIRDEYLALGAHVSDALIWLIRHQRKDGLWRSGYGTTRDPLVHHWVTFAVARMLGRFFVEGG